MTKEKLIFKIAKHLAKRIELNLLEGTSCCFDSYGKKTTVDNYMRHGEDAHGRAFFYRVAKEIIRMIKK